MKENKSVRYYLQVEDDIEQLAKNIDHVVSASKMENIRTPQHEPALYLQLAISKDKQSVLACSQRYRYTNDRRPCKGHVYFGNSRYFRKGPKLCKPINSVIDK